ncbi:MAG TPA: DNA-3-methyladenine glycosylase [Micromonosporaceae bacterium]|nr:DNA-3-methyladenine glycosylase [Micromonosporaceae bacterium]
MAAAELAALLAGPADAAARGLLGCQLSGNGVTVRLTEVEAYAGTGEDPASHAHRGRTRRNAVMFGPPGHLYAYFVYGAHWCLNVVCGAEGQAAAVLLRAGEVAAGVELARRRRPGARDDRSLARGPANLVRALGVDGAVNGTSAMTGSGPVMLGPAPHPLDPARISAGPRVGVTAAHDLPWRYWIDGDPTVSPYRRHVLRRRRPGTREAG